MNNRPVTAALVGVGEFGASFLFRSGRARDLQVVAAVDPDIERVTKAARAAGYPNDKIHCCETPAQVKQALEASAFAALTDSQLLDDTPLDFIVEATGAPESAAQVAVRAIDNGHNVAMVTKECDSVVGPALQARARNAGLVCTVVDGDQPSLTIALIDWAHELGLEVVCAGKASEYDFVMDLDANTVLANGNSHKLASISELWSSSADNVIKQVQARAHELSMWPHRTTPDLCELCIIANATELNPSSARLHAPIARTLELPNLLRPVSEGGLLAKPGSLDMFNCLRRPDEISFAGGVFVVVRSDDPSTWRILRDKGIPMSDDLSVGLLHNPIHLLGIEAPVSLLRAIKSGQPGGLLRPRYDLLARTTKDLKAGQTLAMGARHSIIGLQAELLPAQAVTPTTPVPFYMAANQQLQTDLNAGQVLRTEHLVAPKHSTLWSLRAEQDRHFFPEKP